MRLLADLSRKSRRAPPELPVLAHYRKRRMLKVRGRLRRLLRQPLFWLITGLGNGLVVVGALIFHWLEAGINPGVRSYLDSLSWSVGIVTSIGYATISPITPAGKIVGILLMMSGTLFLWSYMGFLVSALIAPDLVYLEKEVEDLESDLSEMRKELRKDPRG